MVYNEKHYSQWRGCWGWLRFTNLHLNKPEDFWKRVYGQLRPKWSPEPNTSYLDQCWNFSGTLATDCWNVTRMLMRPDLNLFMVVFSSASGFRTHSSFKHQVQHKIHFYIQTCKETDPTGQYWFLKLLTLRSQKPSLIQFLGHLLLWNWFVVKRQLHRQKTEKTTTLFTDFMFDQ